MSDIAIRVENLGKLYRTGQLVGYRTIRDTLMNALYTPFRLFRHPVAAPGTKSQNADSESIWALKDVSFTVENGEALGIIGPNGAGKTTLLKVLTRITEPTEGYAEVHGRVGSLLEVGSGFHAELTGRENVYLNGAVLGMRKKEIDHKFDEIVEFAGVEKFIDTPLKRYSSGMQVRLAFSVAAHLEPEILLVDEVLAVGDAAFQKKCLGKMKDVTRGGRTVLFVSHNMGAVSSLTNSCLHLDSGYLVEQGETDTVIKNYLAGISEEASDQGWADLTSLPHVTSYITGGRESAVLERVRLINSQGEQVGTFLEGEPVRIETVFLVKLPLSNIELACNIRTMDGGTSLFMSPSGQRTTMLSPGRYSISSVIEPNHLRAGIYILGLYLFVGGVKEDVVSPALQFSIEPYLAPDDNPFYLKWATGFFRFDYHWEEIIPYGGDDESI
jgi:lipopolysaccharide transport system ATP-binding protein